MDDFQMQYIVNPRVANEGLRPYKAFFAQHISDEQANAWRADPQQLAAWIGQNIALDTTRNPQNLRMTPVGAWLNRCCDATSRDILFVAIARSCHIPARIDPVTRKLQFAQLGATPLWTDVSIEEPAPAPSFDPAPSINPTPSVSVATKLGRPSLQGALSLTYLPTRFNPDPKYYTHFTLSQIKGCSPVLLNYGEGDTYRNLFGSNASQFDCGDYMLVTGTRLATGSVLTHIEVFPIVKDQKVKVPLMLRQADTGLQVIGNFNSENLYNDLSRGTKSLLSTTGRGYYILGIIAPNSEPSNHALRDIAQCKQAFDQWGLPFVLLFRNEQDAARFSDTPALPDKTFFGTDIDGKILSELCTEMHINNPILPIFIIADTFNRVVFLSEGYTIGLGEQLIKAGGSGIID